MIFQRKILILFFHLDFLESRPMRRNTLKSTRSWKMMQLYSFVSSVSELLVGKLTIPRIKILQIFLMLLLWGSEDYIWGSEDYIWGSEYDIWGSEDYIWGSEDYIWGSEDYIWGSEDDIWGSEDYIWGLEKVLQTTWGRKITC